VNGALYDGDSLSNLLTLQRKLLQLILSPLYNHLQILVPYCLEGFCRVSHGCRRVHDIWSCHNITSNATLETKKVRTFSMKSPTLRGQAFRLTTCPVGPTNTFIGCTPLNGFSITGDFGKSVPQTIPSSGGV
jgi:hypothetical protein